MQIVIAWTEEGYEWDGKSFAADLGARPEMKPVVRACTAVWLNEGTPDDIPAAEAYAAQQGYKVFTFENADDPREAARRAILAGREREKEERDGKS